MLTTGIDAHNVRNIIWVREVNSMVEFKQILGRGTRLLEVKDFFTIIDFNKKEGKRNRLKYFNEHGIRLAIAIAPLERFDPEKGIIDGEAIYLSGRAIKRNHFK